MASKSECITDSHIDFSYLGLVVSQIQILINFRVRYFEVYCRRNDIMNYSHN